MNILLFKSQKREFKKRLKRRLNGINSHLIKTFKMSESLLTYMQPELQGQDKK